MNKEYIGNDENTLISNKDNNAKNYLILTINFVIKKHNIILNNSKNEFKSIHKDYKGHGTRPLVVIFYFLSIYFIICYLLLLLRMIILSFSVLLNSR